MVAALVLLVWWARTWRKGRNRRPRAHMSPVSERAPSERPVTTDVPTQAPPRRNLSLSTAATYVALGTGVSRLTGLLRIVALAWALGAGHLADAFNLANTTPNMLYDIVAGGILSATFIPVFVEQLSTPEGGRGVTRPSRPSSPSRSSSSCSTTVIALVLAPEFITALTALDTMPTPTSSPRSSSNGPSPPRCCAGS